MPNNEETTKSSQVQADPNTRDHLKKDNEDVAPNWELFKQLCISLRVYLKDPDAGTTHDALALRDYMLSYAKQKWNEIFEFEYKGQKTEPLDKKPNKPVQSFEKLFFLKEFPASTETVEKSINSELFNRTYARFPQYVRADLYDDLRDQILYYASKETPKEVNKWFEAGYTREYIDPSDNKRDIKHYGLFVYALGDMALDKVEGAAEGVQKHAQCLFMFYLGVMSSFVPSEK